MVKEVNNENTNQTDKKLLHEFIGTPIELFLRDILSYPRLSEEETNNLIELKLKGDRKARELLINANLRLVVFIAKDYAKNLTHMKLLDVIQEGAEGLIKGVDTFNPTLGKFSPTISFYIKSSIIKAIKAQEKTIRRSKRTEENASKYLRLIESYEKNSKPLPKKEEICDILSITPGEYDNVIYSLNLTVDSTNEIKEDNDLELESLITSNNDSYEELENNIDNFELLIVLKETLTPLEYYITCKGLVENISQPELSKTLGLSPSRISQLKNKIKLKIIPFLNNDNTLYEAKQKVINKYKSDFYNLNINVINPSDIIMFHYMKSYLSKLQINILKEKLFGTYKFHRHHISRKYNIPIEKVNESIKEIEQIKKVVLDSTYERIKDEILKSQKTNIYSFKIDNNEDNYEYLLNTYGNLSYDELKELYGSRFELLSKEVKDLLKRFLDKPIFELPKISEIERIVNLVVYNYKRKNTKTNTSILYKTYLEQKDLFTEEQRLALECFYFNTKDKAKYKEKYFNKKHKIKESLEKLEKLTYNIHLYFYNDLTKEQYISVRSSNKISAQRKILLDMFYGINVPKETLSKISSNLSITEDEVRNKLKSAKDFCLSIYMNKSGTLDINKSLYIPYIENPKYLYTEDTLKALKLYLIENKNYDEISKVLNISLKRATRMVNEGLNRINQYRFNIIKPFSMSLEELNEFFDNHPKFTELDKEVITLKYTKFIDNEEIINLLNIKKPYLKSCLQKFNRTLDTYKTINVKITDEIVKNEINKHEVESVLSSKEKEILSMFYGIKSIYNMNSKKYSEQEICKHLNINHSKFNHCIEDTIKKIKLRQIGQLNPDLIFIERNEISILLEDPHIPISNKSKYIISSLLGINGIEYKTLEELSKELNKEEKHVKDTYIKSIVNIYKYINGELEGILSYETDILPNLKYFSKTDRLYIIEYFKNDLSYYKIADKYKITYSKVKIIFDRIMINLHELVYNPKCKKFDFEFYEKNKNNPLLPFYGDLKVATQAFELVTGMNGEERIPATKVIEKLNLKISVEALYRLIYSLMISMCKLKNGIEKENTFTFKEAEEYYNNNKEDMSPSHSRVYIRYFGRNIITNTLSNQMSSIITDDLLKVKNPNYIRINNMSKKQVINLLNTHSHKLTKRIKLALMNLFDIKEREFMSGKEKMKVYKILNLIDTYIKMESNNKLQEIITEKEKLENLSNMLKGLNSENQSLTRKPKVG